MHKMLIEMWSGLYVICLIFLLKRFLVAFTTYKIYTMRPKRKKRERERKKRGN